MTFISQLQKLSTIVLDTADIDAISTFALADVTTNPSLILSVISQDKYQPLLQRALSFSKKTYTEPLDKMAHALDSLTAIFASEILSKISGRLSIQIDARLCFDTDATVKRARHLLSLCQMAGVNPKRVLLKIIATWEGLQAVNILEASQISCNPTVVVSMAQAMVAAQSHATMMACYVARVADWYKTNQNDFSSTLDNHPGVLLVSEISHYLKTMSLPTKVMAASFRSIDEVVALAGCDLLTLSPQRIQELHGKGTLPRKDSIATSSFQFEQGPLTEQRFHWLLCQSAMSSEVLNLSIRQFTKDTLEIEKILASFSSKPC